ncbi:helix-turn-helix domain-containing protein [Oceanidesulfovibrio marinus]|uniref:Chromosomal replication initiator protein DnaA n=1 Tax=Oceanidesulfovibrio marinus TaxID=370038 RepID=A0ABX6NHH5_9BACT|nr:DnaA/Hda family protein [Oceanidesulfovibrio marinus]QJT10054.1 AAA family ATPase [Oceanidesulfovibrio marinus]
MKDSLRQHLRQSCTDEELKRWFDPLVITPCDEERCFTIRFPHRFFAEWFSTTVRDKFEEQLSLFLGPGYTLRYADNNHDRTAAGAAAIGASTRTDFPFGHAFTLENYIANQKNHFPLATARQVAKARETQYNPFVICGPSGSGKTHLLKAMANEMSKTVDSNAIFYGTPDDLRVMVGSNSGTLKERFNDHVCLVLDDFHRVQDLPGVHEALLELFDDFHDSGRQMLFASTQGVAGMDNLPTSLKSRVEGGLVITLKQHDLDVRTRYVKRLCQSKRLKLTKTQMLTLAQRFEDFRFLQGILLKLFAFKELVHKEIQDKDFQSILQYAEETPASRVDPDKIMHVVADHFQVPVHELAGHKRSQNIVFARQMGIYLCRSLLGLSYPALGRLFGGKDHSTAMYAVKKIDERMADDPAVKHLVTQLKKKCS